MSRCKLEASKLRFDRWGTAIGIEDPSTRLCLLYEERDVKSAFRWLREIKERLDAAVRITDHYTRHTQCSRASIKQTRDQYQLRSGLRVWLSRINDKYVKPRKRDRFTWALHHKERLKVLIEDISQMTQDLVELFPPSSKTPTESRPSICNLGDATDSSKNETSGEDSHEFTTPQTRNNQQPHVFSCIELRDGFRGHFGHNLGVGCQSSSSVYSNIIASGDTEVHFGNNIGLSRQLI